MIAQMKEIDMYVPALSESPLSAAEKAMVIAKLRGFGWSLSQIIQNAKDKGMPGYSASTVRRLAKRIDLHDYSRRGL